jgi:ADP-ribose pyrophosphatase
LEPDEPPLETAHRELIEETGYRAGQLKLMTAFFAAPGILDEWMHLFLATELTAGSPAREPGERIENYVVTVDHALDMVRRGEIHDAKTIVGLLFYQQFSRSQV